MPRESNIKTLGLLSSYTLTTTAGALTVPVKNRYSGNGLITVVTAAEVATASLQMALNLKTGAGADLAMFASLGSPITANGTNRYFIGSYRGASPLGIVASYEGYLTEHFDIVLTVTGSSASFDVSLAICFV